MVLQALNNYYETLCSIGELSIPGWSDGFKVSFGLDLDKEGNLIRIIDLREEKAAKNKTILIPRLMRVPSHPTRASGIVANFLCDNSGYMLGMDDSGKKERTLKCFTANKTLHEKLLTSVEDPAAQAIVSFFRCWKPDEAEEHPVLIPYLEFILMGVNLIFCYDGTPVTEIKGIQDAWQDHYDAPNPFTPKGQCLITGKEAPIAAVHPRIKGVSGAQSSGAALVSFNAPAFCSYGQKQNFNAPVSERSAFAYTTALNTLLADRSHCITIGDTTIVCWAEHGEHYYQDAYISALFGVREQGTEDILEEFLSKLRNGDSFAWESYSLEENEHFYVLGLSPNAARLSVRFFYKDSFGVILKNIQKHYEDIAIGSNPINIPLWRLLNETVNENSKSKAASPQLAGEVLRSILNGTPYPATLLNGVMQHIRADRKVNRGRAAIIKAYYLRSSTHFPKEVLTLEVNKKSTSIPYNLGRLFSVYEQIQDNASPGLNATIKDKYFNAAAGTPARVFPLLNKLAIQSHLRKVRRNSPGLAIYFERMLNDYSCRIGTSYPISLSIEEQGTFFLGYFHENQARYTSKNEKSEKSMED